MGRARTEKEGRDITTNTNNTTEGVHGDSCANVINCVYICLSWYMYHRRPPFYISFFFLLKTNILYVRRKWLSFWLDLS